MENIAADNQKFDLVKEKRISLDECHNAILSVCTLVKIAQTLEQTTTVFCGREVGVRDNIDGAMDAIMHVSDAMRDVATRYDDFLKK